MGDDMNYKNTLVAMILALIIIMSGTFIVNKIEYSQNYIKAENNKFVFDTNEEKKKYEEVKRDSNEEKSNVISNNLTQDNIVISTNDKNVKTIEYFNNAEKEIDDMSNNIEKLKTEGKALFVKLVDFVFYDTTINGITFKELTEETQDKLVDIINRIDLKIEEKIPGYKETIKDYTGKTYVYLSEKLKQGITYIDEKIYEEVGAEKYDNFKQNFDETIKNTKENLNIAIDASKEILDKGKDKIKTWYEGWK